MRSQGAGDILLISSFVGDLYGVASYYQYSQLVHRCPVSFSNLLLCIIFASLQNHFTNTTSSPLFCRKKPYKTWRMDLA